MKISKSSENGLETVSETKRHADDHSKIVMKPSEHRRMPGLSPPSSDVGVILWNAETDAFYLCGARDGLMWLGNEYSRHLRQENGTGRERLPAGAEGNRLLFKIAHRVGSVIYHAIE